MFVYKIVHLTLRAPQIVVCAYMYANVYLTTHLLQRQKYFRIEGKLKVCSAHHQPEPSLGIQTVFYRQRNKRQVSCLLRTKQPDNFPSTVFKSNEHGWSFPVLVGLRQQDC